MANSWNSSWTPEREEKLKELWATDLTAPQIAAELGGFEGLTRGGASAILGKANRMGLPPRGNSIWAKFPELLSGLKRCISNNWSSGKTAEYLGITKNQAIGKSFRLGRGFHSMSSERKPHLATDRRKPANGTSIKHIKLRKTGEFFVEQPVREVIGTEIPREQRKSLLELSDAVCRYPIGDVGDENFFFCGGGTNDNPPYCAFHTHLCFTQPQPRTTPAVFRNTFRQG